MELYKSYLLIQNMLLLFLHSKYGRTFSNHTRLGMNFSLLCSVFATFLILTAASVLWIYLGLLVFIPLIWYHFNKAVKAGELSGRLKTYATLIPFVLVISTLLLTIVRF